MSHRHVTLRQFRYFVAVAESGSVASASRMLDIAQSALTKSLMELEAELGSSLFERSSKGMTLTPQGHRFLVSARKVIGSVADAMRLHAGEAAAGVSGVLSVEKRKLKSTSTEPGTTLSAPVPEWMFEIWKLVGGNASLPLSHSVRTSSASAGASRWIGFFTR